MEGNGTGISRLDCYEDMFKEITRKLYGEDPDHRTSSVQNEFETSASYKTNDEDTGNGPDETEDTGWTCEDEPFKGTEGSRIAAYHAGKAAWRCYECGECMGGGPRDAAEHFIELHSSRILDDSRVRHHSARSSSDCRKDYLQADVKIDDLVGYLERLRDRAERTAPPARRTQETQTTPATLLPPASAFLLQELPPSPSPQHLHQQSPAAMPTAAAAAAAGSGKRYTCPYCPYGTDRRDLYTRHENIHREEKPFHCYVCYKPFNRADHVKKHFLRMHREHRYELSRIRRPAGSGGTPKPLQQDATTAAAGAAAAQHPSYPSGYNNNKSYQLHQVPGSGGGLYQATAMPAPGIMQPEAGCGRRMQNGGCNSKSHLKGGSKGAQERRYTCCYCSWSGVDNWCLKRHLNTHLKPFACALCEYKAARAERLATHVLKVHNRRQCSRCSFLGEDAAQLQLHQLHVHRVTNANAPAPPAQPQAPQATRHLQQLQPSGGGRPPPGPPVFPAPAPAIAPATTVIPPTTILGHEMVNSPAAEASQAPSLPDGEFLCSHCGCDFLQEEDLQLHRVIAPPSSSCSGHLRKHQESVPPDFKCSICSENCVSRSKMMRHMRVHSGTWTSGTRTGSSGDDQTPGEHSCTSERRSRKQMKPRKIGDGRDQTEERTCTRQSAEEPGRESSHQETQILRELRERYLAQLVSRRGLLRCLRCPRRASARAFHWVPYHTKATLGLHVLWRHRRSKVPSIDQRKASQRTNAVTLQATVYARRDYQR